MLEGDNIVNIPALLRRIYSNYHSAREWPQLVAPSNRKTKWIKWWRNIKPTPLFKFTTQGEKSWHGMSSEYMLVWRTRGGSFLSLSFNIDALSPSGPWKWSPFSGTDVKGITMLNYPWGWTCYSFDCRFSHYSIQLKQQRSKSINKCVLFYITVFRNAFTLEESCNENIHIFTSY